MVAAVVFIILFVIGILFLKIGNHFHPEWEDHQLDSRWWLRVKDGISIVFFGLSLIFFGVSALIAVIGVLGIIVWLFFR